jgi:PAS domain S-box-containing protein
MAILRGPQFVIEIANAAMYALWGKGEAEMLGRSIFEALPEVRHQGYEELLIGVYSTGERFTALGIPVTLPRNEGIETVFINLLYEAFREGDGTISGVIVVATDVTAQVTARMKVEESHKEFQFVTDFMPQLIWVTRADGFHYYYNKQWFDYTGLTYEETAGDGWNQVFHPEDQQRAWKAWRDSLDTGEPYEIEYRCRRWDGAYRWFLGRAVPLKDNSDKILKWFGTCTDIDDQKKAAEIMEFRIKERTDELRNINQELSRSNQNLEQFAHAASHDMKEPIRKILTFSSRLRERLTDRLDQTELDLFERMDRAGYRMSHLVEDLLNFSLVSQVPQAAEEVDLNITLADVLTDLEHLIEQKRPTINIAPLPTIIGYKRQLQQLFQNLVTNALKYGKAGVLTQIEITSRNIEGRDSAKKIPITEADRSFYLIEVKDNGIGFEREYAERIFGMFQRLHGNTEYEGSGVGLAIARKVAENHNGYIWGDSKSGEGATFTVLLPAT